MTRTKALTATPYRLVFGLLLWGGTALPAYAGGMKGLGVDLDKLLWVFFLLSTLWWLPPVLGGVRLLTRRPGERSAVLGVCNILAALLWLIPAQWYAGFALGALVCAGIGLQLLNAKAPIISPPPAEAMALPDALTATEPPAAAPPLTHGTGRGRLQIAAWCTAGGIILLMVMVRHCQPTPSPTPVVYETTLPAPAPDAAATDAATQAYATDAEVHAVAARRARAQATADSLAQQRAQHDWDTPADARP